jgi:cell division protein FtsZ
MVRVRVPNRNGKRSADESPTTLAKSFAYADLVFITAGMGGGTGTGAAPTIADIARESGILTVGVVTKPFSFEGKRRMQQAEEGIRELLGKVDSLLIIPNDRLKYATDQRVTFANAFAIADDVLHQAVTSISDLIKNTGFINLDFADVTTIMKNAGFAHMGVGHAAGKGKAEDAARMAVASPLMETSIDGARGVLINITGSMDMGLEDVEARPNLFRGRAHPYANILFGATFDDTMHDAIRVTDIATGFDDGPVNQSAHRVKARRKGSRPVYRSLSHGQTEPSAQPAAPAGEKKEEDPSTASSRFSIHNLYCLPTAPCAICGERFLSLGKGDEK